MIYCIYVFISEFMYISTEVFIYNETTLLSSCSFDYITIYQL